MNSELFNQTTDFCRTISLQSKGARESDSIRLFFDSKNNLYTQAQSFLVFDKIAFKDVYDEDYQYEFQQNYLDTKLLEIEEEGIWIHKGLEYILFYYLIDTFKDSIHDFLTVLAQEEEKKTILLHDKSYEINKHFYKNNLDPLLNQAIEDYKHIKYLFEHTAQFIYRATDFIMVEKKSIEFVLEYSKRFHFEKINELLIQA